MADEEPQPVTIVSTEVQTTLQWCLIFMTKLDEAESARDLANIVYSPLTLSVAQSLHSLMEYQPTPDDIEAKVHQVLSTMVGFAPTSPRPMPPR